MGGIGFPRAAPVIGGPAKVGLVVSVEMVASREGRLLVSAVYFLGGICACAAGWGVARLVAGVRVPFETRLRLAVSSGETLLAAVRALRHDFLNHLQVLQGMLQLGKPEQARDYAGQLVEQLTRQAGVLHLASSELVLLLLGAREVAAQEGVRVEINVGTSMERSAVALSGVRQVLCRILEKMVTGVRRRAEFEKRLEVVLSEGEGFYEVRVRGRTAVPDFLPAAVLCRELEREMRPARRSGCRLQVSRGAGGLINCLLTVPAVPRLEYAGPRAGVDLVAERPEE